ncbi:retrovirus-related pol polyprotein from transposon TNT 1-94, partial [Tanacetum coccineum]
MVHKMEQTSGVSRHMTWVKQYLNRYSKESGPKVAFGDDSSGDIEGYVLVNCNGITFTRVAYMNGLKHNLISIGQLCDANFKVLFTKTRGTIFDKMMKLYSLLLEEEMSTSLTLIEAARTMLTSVKLPKQFWGEAVNTACYTQNKSTIVKRHGKTTYDVFRGRSHDISYFHVFRCPVHIHNHKDHLGKFNEKVDDGFFLCYSPVAKAFRVFIIRRQEMEETIHVTFSKDDESISQSSTEGDAINFNENQSFPDDEFLEPRSKVTQCPVNIEYFPYIPAYENTTPTNSPILQDFVSPEEPPEFTSADDHTALNEHDHSDSTDNLDHHIKLVNIIGEPLAGITTRSRVRDSEAASTHECLYANFLFEMDPKKLIEAWKKKDGLLQHIIVARAENPPLMLKKSMYDSWTSCIRLLIKGKKHGRMMLDSIDNGPLVYLTVEENGRERYPDPLAFVANSPTLYNPSQLPQHSASRFPPSNNQLRTLSNPINQATIQDGIVTVQQVQGRQNQSYARTGNRGIATTSKGNVAAGQPRVMKCYSCQGEGHMARQCTQPKRPRNAAWFKDKLMLAEAQEVGKILDEEQLAFLADPGISEALVAQQTIPQNSAFQTDDLDAYDSDCDDLSSAKAVMMANLLSCDPEVLFGDTNPSAPNDLLVLSLVEQMTDHVAHLDKENQTNKMVNESLTAELERYKERITIFEQRLNVDLN